MRPIMVAYTVTILHKLDSSSLGPVQQCPHSHLSSHRATAQYVVRAQIRNRNTPQHQSTSVEPPDGRVPHGPLFTRRVRTLPARNYAWRRRVCESAPSADSYTIFRRGGGVVAPTFRRHTLLGEHHTVAMEPAIQPSARRRQIRRGASLSVDSQLK